MNKVLTITIVGVDDAATEDAETHVKAAIDGVNALPIKAKVALGTVPEIGSRGTALSVRETQILGCLVEGLPNKTIAYRIGITEETVKVHLKGLLRKIDVQNRTQAAMWAVNNGYGQQRAA